MANTTRLPPESRVDGLGRRAVRASVLVDVSTLPAVSRRRQLNERLLEATCAADIEAPPEWRFAEEDLELILRITLERFAGETAFLRRQAVLALGNIEAEEASQRLVELTANPAEHDSIRIAALKALKDRRCELIDQLCDDASPAVRQYARTVRDNSKPKRRHQPGQVPRDITDRREEHIACREESTHYARCK